MEKIKSAIPAEANEAVVESVGDAVSSEVESIEQTFQEPQSDDTASVERKEDGKDKDRVPSTIDANKDAIGMIKERRRLDLLDTIAKVQRKYLEVEEVRLVHFCNASVPCFLFSGSILMILVLLLLFSREKSLAVFLMAY
jgi:vacuolar-type H+-ATPase subunit I/STV1